MKGAAGAAGALNVTPWPIPAGWGVAVCAALLLGLLGGARWWQRRAAPHPETARKVMHIGVGLITLTFPWLLHEAWAALLVCALTIGTLLGLRYLRPLRRQVGGVLHDVERSSGGDLYFLLSVAGLYLLARGDWVLYVVPLLVLTFADGLAALTGVSYGRRRYAAADGFKSLEGSLAFAAVTFLATHVPLLLFTDTGRAQALAVAALVAMLAMLVEAISWEGLDNLLVPLVTFVALDGHRLAPLDVQLEHLTVIAALTVGVFLLRRRTPLTAGALATAALVAYLCATLGDWRWLVAPLTCAAAAVWLYRVKSGTGPPPAGREGYGVRIVASIAAPGLVWLLTARYFGRPEDWFAFTLTWAAQLAGLALFVRQGEAEDDPMHPVSGQEVLRAGVAASALLLLPWAALSGGGVGRWVLVAQGTLVVLTLLLLCGVLATRQRLTFQRQITLLGAAGLGGVLVLQFL